MRTRRLLPQPRRLALAALLAAVGFAVALPARADAIRCRPMWDFSIEVDGSYPKEALFYQSDSRGKYFIDIPACKSGLLLDLFAKKIVAVPRTLVSRVDGGLQVNDGASTGATAYAYSLDGGIIQFQAEEKKVRVVPALQRPPLTGQVSFDDLLADRAEYREGMKLYRPDADAVAVIGKFAKPIEIEAFFATWCPHCKEYMPKFLRVMQDAKNPRIKLTLVGVPKGFSETPGPWKEHNVTGIPTIIVMIDGKEINRMGAGPGPGPEMELAETLKALR